MDTGWLPLAAFILTAIGWLSRELWRWRKAKRQAAYDASDTLKDKKTLLEDMISKAEDTTRKEEFNTQLEEVNAALLGLYSERLRHTLKEAGLPGEEELIADGRGQLLPQEISRLKKITKEVEALSPFVIPVRDLLLLGNTYFHMQQYQHAKKYYDKILKLNPDYPEALNNRGLLHNKLGENNEALADYNRALALRSDDPTILANRGVIYHDLKKYKEALADYNRSLQIRPDDPETLNNRGATYAGMGKREEALADYNRSLELYKHPHAFYNRGMTYKYLKQYADALINFNRSLELKPDDGDTLYELACLLSLLGQTDDAFAYLEKAIHKDNKYREKAKTDKDLDNIRDNPRFKKLVESD